MSQSRQLAAIMFTDIVGYTALMGEDEQRAFDLLKKNRSVQRPIIEKYNGRWLKEIGDGVLASFPTVTDAVYCAATIQKTCENEPDLKLRIGIHQGEVVFEGEDVFGDGVNIASRLEPLATIGGILVSESVHRNLGNKRGIETNFLREERLKNVKEPIKIYSVRVEGVQPVAIPELSEVPQQVSTKPKNPRKMAFAVTGVIIILLLSYFLYSNFDTGTSSIEPQVTAIDKSIVVLPFTNMSNDPDQDYFSDGMMEEILNHLVKIEGLNVISRTTSMQLRGTSKSVNEITNELNVATALEGSVRKDGDRVRITVQLIRGDTDMHLWSESYDRELTDIFEVQSDVAKQIASALGVVIAPTEEASIDKIPTANIAAYDLYVRARHERQLYWNTFDVNHLKLSHEILDRALKIDPEYLQAIVAKGNTFSAEKNYDSALVYAERVLAVDPEFRPGYSLKGGCYYFMGKLDLAVENYLKAIDLPPKDDKWLWSHVALGRVYDSQNQVIKALQYLNKGLEVDDEDLPSAYFWIARAFHTIGDYENAEAYSQMAAAKLACFGVGQAPRIYFMQGKIQEAIQFADSTCQVVNCPQVCSRVLFRTSLLLGEFEKAEQYFYQWQNSGQDFSVFVTQVNAEIGYVYHQLGRTEEAEKIFTEQIEKLESELYRDGPYIYLGLARIYAFKGEKTEALNYLTKSAERGFRDGWHDFILIDPLFESLRDDPEFKAIVKQEQEEKAALRAQVREMEERGELTL